MMSYSIETRIAKDVGQIIAIVFAVLGFVYTNLVVLPLIAVAIFYGAITEEKLVQARAELKRLT